MNHKFRVYLTFFVSPLRINIYKRVQAIVNHFKVVFGDFWNSFIKINSHCPAVKAGQGVNFGGWAFGVWWCRGNKRLIETKPKTQTLLWPLVAAIWSSKIARKSLIRPVEPLATLAELPEILTAPQSQTIKLGKAFVLECDADGNPLPTIDWEFNGVLLAEKVSVIGWNFM